MADDEVRPGSEPRPSAQAGSGPGEPGVAGAERVELPAFSDSLADSAMPVNEPTMAGAGEDLSRRDPLAGSVPPGAGPSRRSMMPVLLSAIGLVLIALLGVNLYMMSNPPGRDELPALQVQMIGLQQRIGSLEARPNAAAALGPVDVRVKALDARLAQLSSDLADTQSRLAAQPQADQAPNGETANQIEALAKRIEGLDHDVADLKQGVAALPKPDLQPLQAKTTELQSDLDGLKASVAALPKVDLEPLDAKLAALDKRLTPIETEFSAPKTAEHVTEARQEGSAAEARAAPLAAAAQAILQALDEGRSFAPAVAALQALGVDPAKLAALRSVADRGAPSRADLAAGFSNVRDALVAADTPKPTGTVLDRMVASAQGLVKIRAAGANPGNDVDAVAARIEADLDRSRFAAALAEWDHLPEASKAASSAWAERLKMRVAPEEAARSVAAEAIAAIGSKP